MTNDHLVDRLTRIAGGRGSLSADQLRQAVPVEAMSIEEIASLIAALEERGVSVEVDPALMSPRHPLSPEARAAAAARPVAESPPRAAPNRASAQTAAPASSLPPRQPRSAGPPSWRAAAVALVALVVVAVVLAALIRAF